MTTLTVNQKKYQLDVDPATPLLWVLREKLQLTGTKFGCGMALCGACTVHLDGEAVRSCVTPMSRAAGKDVVTVEGTKLNQEDPDLAKIVNLRCFAGMTVPETAAALGVSPSTVDRQWACARAWLFREITET